MAGGRIELMGMPVDALTEPEVVGRIMGALEAGRGGSVITPHLEILRRYRREPEVRRYFDAADLVVADGQPLTWASRLRGTPLPERVAGSDLVWSLSAECALRGRSVYLLGGAPGVCDEARRRLLEVYPGLIVAGCESPPVGFDRDPEQIEGIRRRLRAAQPDIVFVGLGFPKQERVIGELRDDLPGAWFLGIGVSMSFVAGHVARAPDWAIRYGLEWFHRLLQEPRRLFKRYIVHGIPFALRLLTGAAVDRLSRAPGYEPPSLPTDAAPEPPSVRVVFHRGQVERARLRDLAEVLASQPDGRVPSSHDDEREHEHTAGPPVAAGPERLG